MFKILHEKDVYVLDTETTTKLYYDKYGRTDIVAWVIMRVSDEKTIKGLDIKSMLYALERLGSKNSKVYIHNLKFDFSFIEDFLLLNDFHQFTEVPNILEYEQTIDGQRIGVMSGPMTYCVLRNSMATYRAQISFDGINYLELVDSAKLYPLKVSQIGEIIGIKKLTEDFDYNKFRNVGDDLTKAEWGYVMHDVLIIVRMLKYEFSLSQLSSKFKMPLTRSSLAYKIVKGSIDNWKQLFPELSLDEFNEIKPSYGGGKTFVNPTYANVITDAGVSIDRNSMHPASASLDMPVGKPQIFEGLIDKDNLKKYPLCIYKISVDSIRLKKGRPSSLMSNQAFMDCGIEGVVDESKLRMEDGKHILNLAGPDMELLLKNYDVYGIHFIKTYAFKNGGPVFKDIIAKLYKDKQDASDADDLVRKSLAKLTLNSFYGKLAKSMYNYHKQSEVVDGVVHYVIESEDPTDSKGYMPAAIFITAYSRQSLYEIIDAVGYENVAYGDTDSIFDIGDELPKSVDYLIDKSKLGFWKVEKRFKRMKAMRPKMYSYESIEKDGSIKLKVTFAGINGSAITGKRDDKTGKLVTDINGTPIYEGITSLETFGYGKYEFTQMSKRVPGGTLIYEGTKIVSPKECDSILVED